MPETVRKENPLGTAPVGSLMRKFTVPSIVAMLVGAIYNIVDQFFIGQTVGTLGIAATNVAFPLTTGCTALALLFGVGGASNFNLSMGAEQREKAPNYIGNGAVALFVSGTVLCLLTEIFLTPMLRAFGAPDDVLPYAQSYVRIVSVGFPFLILTNGGGHLIRADGSPRMAMICNLSGAVINVVLDALFVMVLDWGMVGAALATVAGQMFSGCQVIWYFAARFQTVPLTRRHLYPRWRNLRQISALGAASAINQVAMLVVQVVLNNSLRFYGGQSVYGESDPLAAAGIVMKVCAVGSSIMIGISQGTQPLISFNYGARRYDRVRQTYRLGMISAGAVGIVCWLFYQLLPRQILNLFGAGSELYFQFGVWFFHIYLLLAFANFVQPLTSAMFTSIGKPVKGAFLSLTRQVLFLVPLLLVLPLFLGLEGVLYACPISDGIAIVVAILMARMEFKNIRTLEARQQGRQ